MSHIVTARGHEYHLRGVYASDNAVDIETIAHALAQINRFCGHTRRPYSVAEHSLLCADISEHLQMNLSQQLGALMHDAHEAFIGDMTSPAKEALGQGWREFEDLHAYEVRKRLKLSPIFVNAHHEICHCDLIALATERRDLLAWNEHVSSAWPVLDTPGRLVPVADWVDLNTLQREQRHWSEWRDLFVERYCSLKAQRREWFDHKVRPMEAQP